MPTYDYECRSCGYRFEAFQKISDDALTDCPECGINQLRRLIGGGLGIIFKGSGFYVTDTRKSESASEGKPPDVSTKPTSSEGSGKSENKTGKASA